MTGGALDGGLSVLGGLGWPVVAGGAEVVVAVELVAGVEAVVVELPDGPLVGLAAEVVTTSPGAGSSSAFAISVGAEDNEVGDDDPDNALATLALPATTAPRATATSTARTVGLWPGDPFTDGDRTTNEGRLLE